jgi:hypothetical protein
MTWQEIRQQHPHSWVLVEALDAFTAGSQRVINDLRLIQTFHASWQEAWEQYKALHKANRDREYYVLHTDRASLDIGVLDTFGWVVASE